MRYALSKAKRMFMVSMIQTSLRDKERWGWRSWNRFRLRRDHCPGRGRRLDRRNRARGIKTLRPQVSIFGVEPEVSPSFSISLERGESTSVPLHPTLADGLAVAQVGSNAFSLARKRVDRTVMVSEPEIALAVIRYMEREKCVVEGGAPLR